MTITVLFLINSLGTGGAERSLAEMLPGLVEGGIRPIVACLYPRAAGVETLVRSAGIDVRLLPGRRTPSRVRAIRRIVRSERPHIVHTTILEASIAGRLACIGSGAVVLSSLVNTPYAPARWRDPRIRGRRLAALRALDGWTARHLTDHFHAISRAVAEHAVAELGIAPDRVTVIERGRDLVRLGAPGPLRRRRARAALGLRDDDEVLVSLGRQDYQKGHRFLLEAVASLAPARPRLVALVAGRPGASSRELERLHAASGLGDRMRFLGHRDDAPEILAAADVFVFPSLFEGLGGSLLEAMALGLPVVASDLPAIREVVEDGASGLLVPPASAEALADAIRSLLGDRERAAALGARGRAIVLERFTLERATERMLALYRRLAARGVAQRDAASSTAATASSSEPTASR